MQLYALQTQNDEAETWKDLVCVPLTGPLAIEFEFIDAIVS